MIKYIVNCSKEVISVMEVEGQMVSALDNPSVMWLPKGEYFFKVTSPTSILEKRVVGKETKYFPVIWHSHNFSDSGAEAELKAQKVLEATQKLYADKNKPCNVIIANEYLPVPC
jgi:hypothetical protein